MDGLALGQEITVDIFAEGEVITVTGTSKGRGFAGGVKRYHFKGQHMTHGYMTHRRPLSNGAATGPTERFSRVSAVPVTWVTRRLRRMD